MRQPMQKIFSIILIVFSLMIIDSCKKNSTGPNEPSVITFADANFETLIHEALDKPTGDIAPDELEAITSLTGTWRDIEDISGIEYCDNLTDLDLGYNKIVNIDEIDKLTSLFTLNLKNNLINDITALKDLGKLEVINLWGNRIQNINSLASLTFVEDLNISENQISDISALSGMTKMLYLWLANNSLNDTSINTYIPQLEARGVTVHQ